MVLKALSSILIFALLPSAVAAAPVSARDCQARLSDIASDRMSGDDTLVLSDCILAGHASDEAIQRAYESAKRARS